MMLIEQSRQYKRLDILARQMVEGFITGLHQSPYHGFSVEFSEHMPYNEGENTKHIDWKVFARTDKLYTKYYEEETNLSCMLLLDQSSSMYFQTGSKASFSLFSAACLVHILNKQRDAVGLCMFSDTIEMMTAVRSKKTHINYLFGLLEERLKQTHTNKTSSIGQVIHEVAERVPRRSLVILFSDMINSLDKEEEIYLALKHLKNKKHEVILFHTLDEKWELDFAYEDQPHIFIDIETGEQEEINPKLVRKDFQEKMRSFREKLKLYCGQYKIDFVEVDSGSDIHQILMTFLIRRKKMI